MPHNLFGRRVLLVEDGPLIAAEIQEELECVGAEVVGPAHDLANALELAAHQSIDVAVLDLDLHGVMSFPVADQLIERDIPFIFTTGYGDDAIPDEYSRAQTLSETSRIANGAQ
jgi:DNA-binding NarL/FixJ family response regulator